MSFFFCHYVILSKIAHLSFFVIMSFCLKKHTCLPPSLCYSVFKTTPSVTPVLMLLCLQNYPVSLCHYVILSKKIPLSPPVPLLFCLQDHPFCYSCPPVTLSSKLPCFPLFSCYSVFKNYLVWLLTLLHISCLRSAFLCCTFASSSGMKTVTGWAFDDWQD